MWFYEIGCLRIIQIEQDADTQNKSRNFEDVSQPDQQQKTTPSSTHCFSKSGKIYQSSSSADKHTSKD